MNYMLWFIGLLMVMTGSALLHDVPFFRFLSALMLIVVGTIFGVLSKQ